jgi:hypothetical protein
MQSTEPVTQHNCCCCCCCCTFCRCPTSNETTALPPGYCQITVSIAASTIIYYKSQTAAAPSAGAQTAGKQRHLYYCLTTETIRWPVTVTLGNSQAHALFLQSLVQPTLISCCWEYINTQWLAQLLVLKALG